jgi:hypothetical protein
MAGIARGRLQEERKSWRKDHPHVRRAGRPDPHCLPPGQTSAAPPRRGCVAGTRRPFHAHPSAGLCREAGQPPGRHAEHPLLGLRCPCQARRALGGSARATDDGLHGGLPVKTAGVQIQARSHAMCATVVTPPHGTGGASQRRAAARARSRPNAAPLANFDVRPPRRRRSRSEAPLPPQRLPLWQDLPLAPRPREGMAPFAHDQAAAARHPDAAR